MNTDLSFVALDFELANESHASICSFGVARVRHGILEPPRHFFVRPEPAYDYSRPINARIHGLHPSQWRDAPTFAQLSASILRNIGDDFIVGHGVKADLSMFTQTLCYAGLGPMPPLRFLDTQPLARAVCPGLERYTLAHCARAMLGVDHSDHHRADADAYVSAQLVLAAAEQGHDVTRFIESRPSIYRLPKAPKGTNHAP